MPKSSEKFGKRGIRLKRGRGCRVGITPPGRPPGCCGWPLLPPTAPPGPVCCLLTPTPPGVPPMPTGPTPPGGIGGGGGGDIEADVPGLKPVGLGGGRGGPVNQDYYNSILQVNNYDIVVKFFHNSHNLTWYSAIVHKFTRINPICSTYELTKQFM